jgi:hypothetical protein
MGAAVKPSTRRKFCGMLCCRAIGIIGNKKNRRFRRLAQIFPLICGSILLQINVLHLLPLNIFRLDIFASGPAELAHVQVVVFSFGGQQLLMTAAFHHFPSLTNNT